MGDLAAPVERAIQSGPFGSTLLHSEFGTAGRLVIGIDNVREGWFSLGAGHRISEAKYKELARYRARPNDFLITVMASIGRTCVVPEDLEPAIITKHVYRITLDARVVSPQFVNLCALGDPTVRAQVFGGAQGGTRPGLNKEILVGILFPIPPLPEQEKIVVRADALLRKAEQTWSEVRDSMHFPYRLRQSILHAAFTGRLVPQDPNDEPASVLLEIIAAERAAEAKPAITRTRAKKARKK